MPSLCCAVCRQPLLQANCVLEGGTLKHAYAKDCKPAVRVIPTPPVSRETRRSA